MNLKQLIIASALSLSSLYSTGCAGLIKESPQRYSVRMEDQLMIGNSKYQKLFRMDDLVTVDQSTKKVKVSVKGAVTALKGNQEEVFKKVKEFYQNINIKLDFEFVDSPVKDYLLDHTKHLYLEFSNAPEFRTHPHWMGYAQIWNNKTYVWLDKCQRYYHSSGRELVNRMISAVIVHELGHLFGLLHTHAFANDSLEDYLKPGKPNCMSYQSKARSEDNPLGCWLTEIQKKRIHSYLSKGKIYQAYKAVGFNFERYKSLVGLVNQYYYFPKK